MPRTTADHLVDLAHAASTPAEHDVAAERLRVYLDGHPTRADLWAELGALHMRFQLFDRATAALRRSQLLDIENPSRMSDVTAALREFDREAEAVATLRCALRRNPAMPQAWHNLGTMARNLGNFSLAEAAFRKASTLWNDNKTRLALGEVCTAIGNVHEAIALVTEVIATSPAGEHQWVEAHMARGGAHLGIGNFRAAWNDFEVRMRRLRFANLVPPGLPEWQPSDAPQRVLVWREQGIGDEIRFLSCLPDLLRRNPDVVLRCSPRLATIVQRSFGVDVVTGTFDVPDDVTAHISVGSLMRHFRNDADEFPTSVSYLTPNPERAASFQRALRSVGDYTYVGVSWRSKISANSRNIYYPDMASLAAFANIPNVRFVDLQYDDRPEERAAMLRDTGIDLYHFDDLDLLNDIEGVLALTSVLDGVVTVGNAVGEIAGAVGTPTIEFAFEHDMFTHNRSESLWHRNTKFCTKTWDAPWTAATEQVPELLTGWIATCRKKNP